MTSRPRAGGVPGHPDRCLALGRANTAGARPGAALRRVGHRGAREVEEPAEMSRNHSGGRDGIDRTPRAHPRPRSVQGGSSRSPSASECSIVGVWSGPHSRAAPTGGAEIAAPRSSGDPYNGCPGASVPSRGPGPLTMANPRLLSSGSTPGRSRRSRCRRSGSYPLETRRRSPDRLSRMT